MFSYETTTFSNVTSEAVWLAVYLAVRAEVHYKPSDKHLEAVSEANRATDAFDERFGQATERSE